LVSDGDMPDIEIPGGWRDQLESLATRRRALAAAVLVAAVALLLLALAGRQAPAHIAPPATSASSLPGAPNASPAPGLLVHVAGAVRAPGLYELPVGARVADAVTAAGGPLARANLDALNLAQGLIDGTKIEVPRKGSSEAVVPRPSPGESGAPIALNSADGAALETIPGIGPVRAAAILTYRDEHGGFASVEELLEVSGIGPATLEAIRPYVTL